MSSKRSYEPTRQPPSGAPADEATQTMATAQLSPLRTEPSTYSQRLLSGSAEEGQGGAHSSESSYSRSYDHGHPSTSSATSFSDQNIQRAPLQSSQGHSKRPPGVAPLANLLHQEPSSPTYSTSPTSTLGRMQISSETTHAADTRNPRYSSELPFDPARGHLHRASQPPSTPSYTTSSGSYNVLSVEGQPMTSLPSSTVEDNRYRLTIVQQPRAARACGHGERDRRMIDPPPILQCSLADYDPNSEDDVAKLRSTWNIVHCFLHSISGESPPDSAGHDVSQITDPNNTDRQLRRLMGTLHMNPFVGIDPETPKGALDNSRIGSFYIFHDLSCRQTGLFRLHFKLTVVDMDFVNPGNRSSVVASATSDVFEVFSAKDFPGMLPSTGLTKELRRQGATVSVKRGNEGRPAGPRHKASTSMDDPQAMEE